MEIVLFAVYDTYHVSPIFSRQEIKKKVVEKSNWNHNQFAKKCYVILGET